MRWTKDDKGRFTLTEGAGLTWPDIRDEYPNGVRKIDWPLLPGGHELTYARSMSSSVDTDRGPWEWGTCRHCGGEVRLWMMEPEECPVGPEWMRSTDDNAGPTFREDD